MEPPSRSSWALRGHRWPHCVSAGQVETQKRWGLGALPSATVSGHQDWFGSVSDGAKLSHEDTTSPRRVGQRQSRWPVLPALGKVPGGTAEGMPVAKPGAQRTRVVGAVRKASCDGRHAFSYGIKF